MSLVEQADRDRRTCSAALIAIACCFRIALGDVRGTAVDVSSVTGEAVLEANRRERAWNFAGSVLYRIYATIPGSTGR